MHKLSGSKLLPVFLFAFLSPLHAYQGEFLPPAHEIFEPLLADPRDLRYAVSLVAPVSKRMLGEAAIGDYMGIYRWTFAEGRQKFQISFGGGVFGRFDLATRTNDMQSSDFFANLPFDFGVGKWASRFMVYHTSSHLGDDYIKRTGRAVDKHSWDNLRWINSYQIALPLRLYAGYTYSFRTLPQNLGRNALQAGAELKSRWYSHGHVRYYWANDYQSWERTGWRPAFNSQAGITVTGKSEKRRALSFYIDYGAGGQPQGQFFLQRETHWGTGVRFDLD